MKQYITRFLRDEEGATAIEYGLIAGMMALILVAVFNGDDGVGNTLRTIFQNVRNAATGTST